MATPTEKEIERIIRTAGQAEEDSDFVDSIKLDAQQITGTRYRFRISNAVQTVSE